MMGFSIGGIICVRELLIILEFESIDVDMDLTFPLKIGR